MKATIANNQIGNRNLLMPSIGRIALIYPSL